MLTNLEKRIIEALKGPQRGLGKYFKAEKVFKWLSTDWATLLTLPLARFSALQAFQRPSGDCNQMRLYSD